MVSSQKSFVSSRHANAKLNYDGSVIGASHKNPTVKKHATAVE